MKLTKRKGFNFFRSYYDVFNELPEKDKLPFIEALLDKQFLGIDPEGLEGLAKFAWISQVNSIESQVKGYEDKTGVKLNPRQGGANTPAEQVEEKGEGEEQVEEKEEVSKSFDEFWNKYDYDVAKRKCQSEWLKLTPDEVGTILNHVDDYVKSTPDKKFRKKPYNYLKEEVYLDEVVKKETTKQQPLTGLALKKYVLE